jgi:hypothetical protein
MAELLMGSPLVRDRRVGGARNDGGGGIYAAVVTVRERSGSCLTNLDAHERIRLHPWNLIPPSGIGGEEGAQDDDAGEVEELRAGPTQSYEFDAFLSSNVCTFAILARAQAGRA